MFPVMRYSISSTLVLISKIQRKLKYTLDVFFQWGLYTHSRADIHY